MNLFATLSVVLVLAGCAGTSPPARFYTLQARIPDASVNDRREYGVVVAPVSVPDLVDRPQLVLRVSPQRVVIMEQSRWAGQLKSAIAGAMAGNLGRLLGDAQVSSQNETADIRVQLEVLAFESHPGLDACIEMVWTIRDSVSSQVLSGRASECEPVNGSAHDYLVAAHEQILARISRMIAADVGLLRYMKPSTS